MKNSTPAGFQVPCSRGFDPFPSLFSAVRFARRLASLCGVGRVYVGAVLVAEYRTPYTFSARPSMVRRIARA